MDNGQGQQPDPNMPAGGGMPPTNPEPSTPPASEPAGDTGGGTGDTSGGIPPPTM